MDVEEEPDERTLREQGFTPEEIADGESLYGLFCPFPIAGEPDFGGVAANERRSFHDATSQRRKVAGPASSVNPAPRRPPMR